MFNSSFPPVVCRRLISYIRYYLEIAASCLLGSSKSKRETGDIGCTQDEEKQSKNATQYPQQSHIPRAGFNARTQVWFSP
jgi:hypothetical protein